MARYWLGKKRPEETRKKMSESHKGKKKSKTHCLNISTSKKGERNPMYGKVSSQWKGEGVGYGALHAWIGKKLGKPMLCSLCGVTGKKVYNWANISHKYKRELTDWIELCASCHKKYDNKYRIKNNEISKTS